MSEGEGAEDTHREPEKLGLRRERKAGPLRMGDSGCWRGRRGGTAGSGLGLGSYLPRERGESNNDTS